MLKKKEYFNEIPVPLVVWLPTKNIAVALIKHQYDQQHYVGNNLG